MNKERKLYEHSSKETKTGSLGTSYDKFYRNNSFLENNPEISYTSSDKESIIFEKNTKIWRNHFEEIIPKDWDSDWGKIIEYFEKANKDHQKLDEKLLNAGISHPNGLIAQEVVRGQKLNPQQLRWLFTRPEFTNKANRNEVIQKQTAMGTKKQILENAIINADRIIQK